LALFVGGGNYVTALLSSVLLALLIGYRITQRDRRFWIPLAVFVCLMGTFLISALSPGNAVRQSLSREMPYLEAIFVSFPHALMYWIRSLRAEYLLGALFALPFLFKAAEESGRSFRYPVLVTLASLCAYACQTTPHLYAEHWIGPIRLRALCFYTSFLFVGGNLYYWLGWVAKRWSVREPVRVWARWAAVGAAVLLVFACAITAVREPRVINGVSAAKDLLDGTARRYDQAMDERVKIYEDDGIQDVVLPRLTDQPYVFPWNGDEWHSGIIAEYYQKNSVLYTDAH